MEANSPSSARQQTRMSLKSQAIPHRDARTTQEFCTVYVGPPAPVHNFSRPNTRPANGFQRPAAHAHKNPGATPKKPRAPHVSLQTPEFKRAQAQRQKTRVKLSTDDVSVRAFGLRDFPSPPVHNNPTRVNIKRISELSILNSQP
jgi:hypothetical protein